MISIRAFYIALSATIFSLSSAQFPKPYQSTKSLFNLACSSLCENHAGDPIDVSGEDFADLISLYLDRDIIIGNITDGNLTDGGNFTDGNFTDAIFRNGNITDSNITESNATFRFYEESDVSLIYGDIECWDVSEVTDMSGAFAFQDTFDSLISCWDVSSVTDMSGMFLGASSFNQNLNQWSGKVERGAVDTTDMFKDSGCDITDDPNTIGRPWCQFRKPIWSREFNCFFFGDCPERFSN